jgi:hypothetical protein
VPLRPSPLLLLAKSLQYLEVRPDALSPPVLCFAQASPRFLFLADPRFHPEDHDLMQPLASGIEASLEIGLSRTRRLRSLGGCNSPRAIGEELELAVIAVLHGRSLIGNSDRPIL